MRLAFEAWVLAALGVYHFGPIPWQNRDDPRVAAIVIGCLLAFEIGARFGQRLEPLPRTPVSLFDQRQVRFGIAAIFMVLLAYHASLLTGRSLLSPDLFETDAGRAYALFQQTLRTRADTGEGLVETVVLVIKAAVFPLVFLSIIRAFPHDRLALAALVAPFLLFGVLRGTDKESVDIAIVLLVLMHAHGRLRRKALVAVALLGVVVLLFATRKLSRFGGGWLACVPAMPEACIDPGSWTAQVLPPQVDFIRLVAINYLTNGFEGLAHALDLPHRFTWGLGAFEPLRQKLCAVGGLGCGLEPFELRLPDAGWDTTFRWQSAFTELANDTHWVFLPLWFAAFGAIFAASWQGWTVNRDPLSLLFVVVAALVFAYLPANFQMGTSVEWSVLFLFTTGVQLWRILGSPIGRARRASPCT